MLYIAINCYKLLVGDKVGASSSRWQTGLCWIGADRKAKWFVIAYHAGALLDKGPGLGGPRKA